MGAEGWWLSDPGFVPRRFSGRPSISECRTASGPLPGSAEAVVAVPAPGAGRGYWAGSSSAALDDDGTFVIAYRVRAGERGRGSSVVARSEDGERFSRRPLPGRPPDRRRRRDRVA